MAQMSAQPADLSVEERLTAIRAATPATRGAAQREALDTFLPLYLNHVPMEDLASMRPEDLNGATQSHWQLLQQRSPGQTRLRVINPTFKTHGWQSAHTVVELVTDDQPHLVSSLQATFAAVRLGVHLIIHPILAVQRDADGRCQKVGAGGQTPETENLESVIHVQIDRVTAAELPGLEQRLNTTLTLLNRVREHEGAMTRHIQAMARALGDEEKAAFLGAIGTDRLTCLGTFELQATGRGPYTPVADSCLGIVATADTLPDWTVDKLIADEALQRLRGTDAALIVTKSARRSPVIRADYIDIALRPVHNREGQVERVQGLVGLFVATLQQSPVDAVPWLRERIARVTERSGLSPASHDGKALASALRSFPRDLALQTPIDTLLNMALGIVSLHERQQIRLLGTTDPLGQYCNCLVYIPRDRYSRELRLAIETILLAELKGEHAEYHMNFSSDSLLAQLHFVVHMKPPLGRDIDWPAIEHRIREAGITWDDRLIEALGQQHDEATALALHRRYGQGFPANYSEDFSARVAVSDIDFAETNLNPTVPAINVYKPILADDGAFNFKLYADGAPVPLSAVMPVIEHMGLLVEYEHPYGIQRRDASRLWIHEFSVRYPGSFELDTAQIAPCIQEAFQRVWTGDMESDGFNRLIVQAGLDWRQIVMLRSFCKYLLQIGVPFSPSYMIDSLVANAPITRLLVELFEARFQPARSNHDTTAQRAKIEQALDKVQSLDEDRILRAYLNLMLATVRTNFYRTDKRGRRLSYVSFKLDSQAIPDLPRPRPLFEIFVYSPRIEGIHLRGGSVARGGLRWSDRREDFRTEVLGLMKAQMVKNAVIVPVGSKGGFYVKQLPEGDRDTQMKEVVACYRTFLRGLLDITDNISGDGVVPPMAVVRHDTDDPYLVVAADKGTATFSDYANAISAEYGFWLGDAFASGGSAGYDHKKMGITARGAWESVKRHFRNLGLNTQTEPFSVVGIGDMGGDVFGNGMLLSEKIRLVAAFNHLHIFIDPDPDPAVGYAERHRLFELPRSSWDDYDRSLISAGGGIFSRAEKQIRLSPEARAALGIEAESLAPTALISALLKAPVDLLWNGGIGTYVKASHESHTDAADRANDALRVDARQLGCRVIGEGGNLGITQNARIEYARHGGLNYTDAIDNAAGVDCSDHEVNIKILLNGIVASDDLTLKQRDALLVEMTDAVSRLVLKDNYLQTLCLDMVHADAAGGLEEQSRFMQHLESINRLDRGIEYLPDNDIIADRLASAQGLSRPELAVLVSYSKMVMYDDLLASDLPDSEALVPTLQGYFPQVLVERFGDRVTVHRLRREIVATLVTNELVNRLGPTFAFRMRQELGCSASDVASAFVSVRDIFDMPELWGWVESLDNQVPADIQTQMQILMRGLVERSIHWLLRSSRDISDIGATVAAYREGLTQLVDAMPECLASINRETLEQRLSFFVEAGVPERTALAVAKVVPLSSSLDVVEIANGLEQPVNQVAGIYFQLGMHLELQWLRERIGELQVSSHWHTLARADLRGELHDQQRKLCAAVIRSQPGTELSAADERVLQWAEGNRAAVEKYRALMVDMKAASSVDFAMLSLAVNEVHKLLRRDDLIAV